MEFRAPGGELKHYLEDKLQRQPLDLNSGCVILVKMHFLEIRSFFRKWRIVFLQG